MPRLLLYNREIETIFQLLGEKENDITYSVGWALYRSPAFMRQFLKAAIGYSGEVNNVTVHLKEHKKPGGFTDIELRLPGEFHIIAEAKRGWNLPSASQLEKYALRFEGAGTPIKRFVVLSECSPEYAKYYLGSTEVNGIPVISLTWKNVASLGPKAVTNSSHAEKRLIRELLSYLGRIMTMQKLDSNWVYVLSLASGTPPGWKISWIDIVRERGRYFHPLGPNWPKDPPNYIAFRYWGKLQSIHHIDAYKVVTRMHAQIAEIPDGEWQPRYLYTLGPAFPPPGELKTGNIFKNGRVWCMLDTLFTCKTISDARDLSKKRERRGG